MSDDVQWKDVDPGCFVAVAAFVAFAGGMGISAWVNGDPWTHFMVFCMILFWCAFGYGVTGPHGHPQPPEPPDRRRPKRKPKPLRPENVELQRTEKGTDPKYTWTFTPDNCFDCCAPFRNRTDGHLSFYTVCIDHRTTRCCPECFPWYRDRWIA